MQLPFFVLLGLNFIFSASGDTLSKLWATHPGSKLWSSIVLACAVLAAFTWVLVVRRTGLAIGSSIMLLLTMIATVLAGLFIFKEQVTIGEGFGVILGVIAALFLLKIVQIP
jgi:drug/metabolite transporter (DMT)-like permease